MRAQRLGELVDDAGAAELGERVVGRTRGDDRAVGQLLTGPVVVGNDDLEPGGAGLGDLLGGGDPAVDGQDEPAALAREPPESLPRDAVALLETARQVPFHLRPEATQDEDGERGRADPIHVVVAVDADAPALLDRRADRAACLLHVAQQERVVA